MQQLVPAGKAQLNAIIRVDGPITKPLPTPTCPDVEPVALEHVF